MIIVCLFFFFEEYGFFYLEVICGFKLLKDGLRFREEKGMGYLGLLVIHPNSGHKKIKRFEKNIYNTHAYLVKS